MGEEVRPGRDEWPKWASSPRKVGSQWGHIRRSLLLARGGYALFGRAPQAKLLSGAGLNTTHFAFFVMFCDYLYAF